MFSSSSRRSACAIVLGVIALGAPSTIRAQCDLSETQKLVAPTPVTNARFGRAVAVDGDTAVVGSPYASVAHVFRFDSLQWNHRSTLAVPGLISADRFGWSVAISGNRIVVGASLEDSEANNSGAAYVFRREGAGWIQEARLTASDAHQHDLFGRTVALDGDRAIVGAPSSDKSGGKAYLFRWDGASWVEEIRLFRSSGNAVYFGFSVAISGNLALVGDPFGLPFASGASASAGVPLGVVEAFRYDGTEWTRDAILDPPLPTGVVGVASALDGDTALVAGARILTEVPFTSLAGFVFRRTATEWIYEATLLPSDEMEMHSANILNATSVSLVGDRALLANSAVERADGGFGVGYLFHRDGGAWSQVATLTPSEPLNEGFGQSVSITQTHALLGASFADVGKIVDAGAAYVFDITDCNDNDTPDTCDIQSAFSPDDDGNGIPDECCPIPCVHALASDGFGTQMNRFVSFIVPVIGAGEETAIAIELTALNHVCSAESVNLFQPCTTDDDCVDGVCDSPFAASEGQVRYVNVVKTCQGAAMSTGEVICRSLGDCAIDEECLQFRTCDGTTDLCATNDDCAEGVSCLASMSCPDDEFKPPFFCATTGCEPEYRNWASDLAGGVLHVYGPGVVPARSEYNLRQIPAYCAGVEVSCTFISDALMITTARWADLTADGSTNSRDITAASDKVKPIPEAFTKVRTMLIRGILDPFRNVNVTELQNIIDAVKSLPVPEFIAGPEDCGT